MVSKGANSIVPLTSLFNHVADKMKAVHGQGDYIRSMRSGSVIAIGCAVGLMACKKERHETLLLEPPFIFCEDTTVVNVPNVFTPDGDGINDKFNVWGRM